MRDKDNTTDDRRPTTDDGVAGGRRTTDDGFVGDGLAGGRRTTDDGVGCGRRTTDDGLADDGIIALDPLELMKRDMGLADRAWNRLSREEQLRKLLQSSAGDRLTLCELARDTSALVQSVPAEELWLTMNAVGKEDALVLIQHASMEQIQFCLDVEVWEKDRWDPQAMFEWLRLVAACGPEMILRFWQETDQELIGLLGKYWIVVYKRLSDEDPADAIPWPREEPPMTLDGQLYYQIADERVDPWLRPMLEVLGRHDLQALHLLMDSIIGAGLTELTELAYEWRGRRLAEHGFPEFDEAMGVYRRMHASDLEQLPKRQRQSADASRPLVGFPLALIQQSTLLLRDALSQCDDVRLQDDCFLELARLANRVVIADGHTISVATLRGALEKVVAFVNIGLEVVSEGRVDAATELLGHFWLTNLFQLGFSRVMEVGERSRVWLAKHPTERASALDDPTTPEAIAFERIKAASWKWPKYYVGPHSPDGILHRDFQTVAELTSVTMS